MLVSLILLTLIITFGLSEISLTYDFESVTIPPTIILYEGLNQTGKSTFLQNTYISNIANSTALNGIKVRSVCVNGTWLLYEHPMYNRNLPGKMDYFSGVSYCTNIRTLDPEGILSLRYAGSPVSMDKSSITFYSKTYFQGDEEFVTKSETDLDLKIMENGTKSLIATGNTGWRLFSDKEFSGDSILICPSVKEEVPIALVEDLFQEFGQFNHVLSVKEETCLYEYL